MTKNISILTLVLLLGLSLTSPQKAQAQAAVVFDPLNNVTNISNQITNAGSLGAEIKNVATDYVLIPAVKELANKLLSKMTNDVINWANGGFENEPGFINNWEDFLKGAEYDVLYSSFNNALKEASLASGENLQIEDLAGQAQANYQNRKAGGDAANKRTIAKTIALFAARRLNQDPIQDIIDGKGETLSKILGSEEAKEAFSQDITVGGWEAYIALTNPSNYPLGVESLLNAALDNETNQAVQNKIDEVQTPVSYLSKTECRNGAQDDEGNCLEGEIIVTPGSLVESKLSNALQTEEDQLKLADELVLVLVRSIGQLTDNLLQQGIASIGNTATSFFDKEKQDFFANFESLNELEQQQAQKSGEPLYVGGPEDVTQWNSVQHIVDFKNDFEPTLNNIQEELNYILEQRETLKSAELDIIVLDRCIPGPDYDWESRFIDNAIGIQATKETTYPDGDKAELTLPNRQNIEYGLKETKIMVNDPRVNIPGALVMRESITRFLEGYQNQQVSDRKAQDIQLASANALAISGEIQKDFDSYSKQKFGRTLPLLSSEWDALSLSDKTYIAKNILGEVYLAPQPGETIDYLVQAKEELVRDAALSFAWDAWARETSSEKKQELRLAYLDIQQQAPDTGSLNASKNLLNTMKNDAQKIKEYSNDCQVLRNYTLNQPKLVNDDTLKAYLAVEYAKQTDGNPATISPYFTTVITAPAAVNNSIIGFATHNDQREYLMKNYPDLTIRVSDSERLTEFINGMRDLFVFDTDKKVGDLLEDKDVKTSDKVKIADQSTSGLFCRTDAVFFARGVDGKDKNHPQSYCYYPWYRTPRIEYRSALYGIY